MLIAYNPLCKKCSYSELFWSAFSDIQTKYGEIRSISAYSVACGKMATKITPNMDTFHAVTFTDFRWKYHDFTFQFIIRESGIKFSKNLHSTIRIQDLLKPLTRISYFKVKQWMNPLVTVSIVFFILLLVCFGHFFPPSLN